MTRIRILIADDATDYRRGMCLLLGTQAEFEVVAEAKDGRAAIVSVREHDVDVVLMDLQMPRMDGIEATQRLVEEFPTIRILALTTFAEDNLVIDALRAGAHGYLLKDATPEQLFDAIRAVREGHSWLHPPIAPRVIAAVATTPVQQAKRDEVHLSSREREVLRALGRGMSNREIAGSLYISEGTVKNHLTRIFERLGVKDRTQAALAARDLGIA